jgi:ABC-type polysaccharide/polyol phosphate export permease
MEATPSASELLPPSYERIVAADAWASWRKTFHLIKHLTRRHLADRYRASYFGFFWSLLNPVLMMCVYTFVFQVVFRQSVPGVRYPAFFLTGYLAWHYFCTAAANAGASVADGGYLIKKAYFPRIVLPISALLSNSFNYLVSLPMLVILIVILGVRPGWSILLLPAGVLLLLLMAAGIGLILASIAPFFRDILELTNILFTVWFFATPILYPMSLVEKSLSGKPLSWLWLEIYKLNPMVGTIRLMQYIFLGDSLRVEPRDLLLTLLCGLVLFAVGLWLFRRYSPRFANAM